MTLFKINPARVNLLWKFESSSKIQLSLFNESIIITNQNGDDKYSLNNSINILLIIFLFFR